MPESCPRTQDGLSDPQTLGSNPQSSKTVSVQLQPNSQDCSCPPHPLEPRWPGPGPMSGSQEEDIHPMPAAQSAHRNDCSLCFKGRTDGPGPGGVSVQPPRGSTDLLWRVTRPKRLVAWGLAPRSLRWTTCTYVHALSPHGLPPHPRVGKKEKHWTDKADGGLIRNELEFIKT